MLFHSCWIIQFPFTAPWVLYNILYHPHFLIAQQLFTWYAVGRLIQFCFFLNAIVFVLLFLNVTYFNAIIILRCQVNAYTSVLIMLEHSCDVEL